jgi:hypothetical protein
MSYTGGGLYNDNSPHTYIGFLHAWPVVREKVKQPALTGGDFTWYISGRLLTFTTFSNLYYSVSSVAHAQPMRQGHQLLTKPHLTTGMVELVSGTVCLNTVLLPVSWHDTTFYIHDMFLHSFYVLWMMEILQLNHNICFCQFDKYLGRLFGLITRFNLFYRCFAPVWYCLFARC